MICFSKDEPPLVSFSLRVCLCEALVCQLECAARTVQLHRCALSFETALALMREKQFFFFFCSHISQAAQRTSASDFSRPTLVRQSGCARGVSNAPGLTCKS